MKFCVETSRGNKGDKVVDRYPYLQNFNPTEVPYKDSYGEDKIKTYIEVAFLADIIDIMNAAEQSVIIHKIDEWVVWNFGEYNCDYIIEIYDDWRE